MQRIIRVSLCLALLLLGVAGISHPAAARGIDVGVNMRYIIHYGDEDVLQHAQAGMEDVVFDELEQHDMPIIRVFVANNRVHNEDHIPYSTTARRLRDFLDKAHERGIRVIACLVDAIRDLSVHSRSIPAGMDNDIYYSDDPNSRLQFLNSYFYREGWKEEYKTFVSTIVSWNRAHRALYAWEPANEMLQMKNIIALDDFKNGIREITDHIRSTDPFTPISTGLIGASHQTSKPSPEELYSAWPAVDIISVHYYSDVDRGDLHGEDITWALENNKTAIVGEIGIPGRGRSEQARSLIADYEDLGAKYVLWWTNIPCPELWDYGDGDLKYGWDCKLNRRTEAHYHDLARVFDDFNSDAHLPIVASITEGAGPAVLGEGMKVSGVGSVTSGGRTRPAKYYWGIDGIDDIETRRFADGRTWTYVIGLDQDDKAEYLMRLGGTRGPKLWFYGIADRPGPVSMNIYIDGVFWTTASWNQNDNRGHWTNIDVEDIPYDDHAVCIEFANDNGIPGESDRALNLYLYSVYAPAAPWPPR